jgi:hypothetical protein
MKKHLLYSLLPRFISGVGQLTGFLMLTNWLLIRDKISFRKCASNSVGNSSTNPWLFYFNSWQNRINFNYWVIIAKHFWNIEMDIAYGIKSFVQ